MLRIPFILLIILTVTFLAFVPSLGNGFIGWDDPGYLLENPLVRELSFKNIKTIFTSFVNKAYHYHPLTIFSFAIEHHFAGFNPVSYHTTNLILHLFNTLLVFMFILILAKEKISAFIVALLFGIHPLNVESVAWVTARKNLLFVLFYLSAMICYIQHSRRTQRVTVFFILTFILFVFSLLSKPAAVTLPLALILIDFYEGKKFQLNLFTEKIPFFILSLALGLLIVYDAKTPFENLYPAVQSFSFLERILLVCYAFWAYLYKLVWPLDLSCYYPYPEKISGHLPNYFAIYLIFVILLLWIMGRFFSKNKSFMFGFLFFIVTICLNFPISTISFTIMADRFAYLPFLGLFLILGNGVTWIYRREGKFAQYRRFGAWFAVIGVILFLFAQTWNRTMVWKNDYTLWNDVVLKYPKVPLAYYFRGNHFFQEQQLDLAIADYNQAIELMPHYFTVYNNRAVMYFLQEKPELALQNFNKAIFYKPTYASAYFNRGSFYLYYDRLEAAIADFDTVLNLEPNHPQALELKNKAVERLVGNE